MRLIASEQIVMQSERRIPYAKVEDNRRKSTNTFGQKKEGSFGELNRFDSFGKSKHIDIPKEEPVNWQNQSFGDSDDHKLFESKRMVDVNIEGSDSEKEGQNFSFCESENKTQRRYSDINNADANILQNFETDRYNYETTVSGDMNLFSEPIISDKFNIEQLLKRPTAVIVPSYVDTGLVISYSEILIT